jgi:Nicotinate-nucleotide pyrophosphorylase
VDRWLISHLNDDRASDSSEGLFVTSVAVAKSNGVLAGRFPVDRLIERFFNSCSVDWVVEEGQRVSSGQELLSLKGPSSSVLSCERVLLNILGRMSGIASSTAEWISEAEGIAVACTRKTAWGLMDKWAVHVGGGLTHRLSRSDALMIKENDLMVLEPEKDSVSAIRSVISSIDFELHSAFTVLEVSELEQATAAAKSWSEEQNHRGSEDRIVLLLDNMGPKACGEVDEELRSMNLRGWCIL